MKLGSLKIFTLLFTLLIINITLVLSDDKIHSVPLINLEELSPTFEEEKDELEKIEDENTNLSTNENIQEVSVTKKNEKIFINIKALDKITAKTSTMRLAIGEKKFFGSLEIRALKCQLSENNEFTDMVAYLQVKDLSNKDLYYFLIDEWYKHYKAIDKQKNKIEVMQNKVQTPKDFDKQLLIGLVSSLGYDTIDDIIEQMKHNGVFSQKEYYSRIKSKYRKMSKMRIEREDTINEINEKVKEVVLVQKSM